MKPKELKQADNIGHQLTTDVNYRKSIWVKFVKEFLSKFFV